MTTSDVAVVFALTAGIVVGLLVAMIIMVIVRDTYKG